MHTRSPTGSHFPQYCTQFIICRSCQLNGASDFLAASKDFAHSNCYLLRSVSFARVQNFWSIIYFFLFIERRDCSSDVHFDKQYVIFATAKKLQSRESKRDVDCDIIDAF